jgi:hypothetical protein
MKKTICFSVILICLLAELAAQNYTFQTHLQDEKLQTLFFNQVTQSNFLEAQKTYAKYQNKIGFYTHYMKAILLHQKGDTSYLSSLVKAFRQGYDMKFLGQQYSFYPIDTLKITTLFKKYYLQDFDKTAILQIDSLLKKDKLYRQQTKCVSPSMYDSLMKLQAKIDNSNQLFLEHYIQTKGFPTALKIGDFFIGITPLDPYIILAHMATTKRDFQLKMLNTNYQLCLQQKESWEKLSTLMFNLHHRFRNEYSEFSGLFIKNNQLNYDKSCFSLIVMARILSQLTDYRFVVKVNNQKLATQFVEAFSKSFTLLEMDYPPELLDILKAENAPLPQRPTKELIDVKIDSSVPQNSIVYKIQKP